ncbi:hypothetical protein JAAARDRAFT_32953 [Jaapia argillacea MUCL 33604]|uniref:Uncharacterized protein n=1 Tax=Jaapia argillacea MUCL 33604 TaxID=933084 RepID=A0A067PXE5_9AGAM|nr:hypothetical protein JAAARDRAFT_32953 [Jaapia argillacea MUCL 33604]
MLTTQHEGGLNATYPLLELQGTRTASNPIETLAISFHRRCPTSSTPGSSPLPLVWMGPKCAASSYETGNFKDILVGFGGRPHGPDVAEEGGTGSAPRTPRDRNRFDE